MIDLSNNNGSVNFQTLRHAGHEERVYLKLSEGASFHDPDFAARYGQAISAGCKVGAYHFARPSKHTPREEADFFLRLLPKLAPGKTLRPCLDLEDPNAQPSERVAAWAEVWLELVRKHIRYHPIIYGSPSYLHACDFHKAPAWLWLASFGRNDGREHPFSIPAPWRRRQVAAHQYASTARVPGVVGNVDLSHVLRARLLDIHRLHVR